MGSARRRPVEALPSRMQKARGQGADSWFGLGEAQAGLRML